MLVCNRPKSPTTRHCWWFSIKSHFIIASLCWVLYQHGDSSSFCPGWYELLHKNVFYQLSQIPPAWRLLQTSNHIYEVSRVQRMEVLLLNVMALFIAAVFHPYKSNGCRRIHIDREITGYRCQPHGNSTIKQLDNMRWDQCKLYCLHNNNCTLVTYDAAFMECILHANMCSNIMQANSDVHTTILGTTPIKCLEWRQFDTPWPANLVFVNEIGSSGLNYAVGRLTSGSRTLPARYNPQTYFITTDGVEKVTNGTAEYLIIDPHCQYQWVTWTSTSGNDLPAGAVVGGHLENGMPLYVAKAWLNISDGIWMISYYNPETGQAPIHIAGRAFNAITMDILVML